MATRQEEAFSTMLRRFREAAGVTQAELAARADLSINGISALERGDRRRPYPHTVRMLADALSLPDTQRAAFIASISRRDDAAVGAEAAAPPPSVPTAATPLIGRAEDLAATVRLLDRARLVTLVGPGGVGKTRLAIEVAHDVTETYRDGVTFVSFAPVDDPDLVVPEIAQAIGVTDVSGEPLLAVLTLALRHQRRLLVLDSLEHLLPVAQAIAELLAACPSIRILATSRAPLRIRGEREVAIRPLLLPAREIVPLEQVAETPAVQLFVDRAQAIDHAFTLSSGNAQVVAAICRRLDGLPLALELAASWIRLLQPTALLTRLDQALPLLVGGSRDLPARQQTMRQTISWSYELLEPAHQTLFRRLSVFAGGFTVDAAEIVAADHGDDPAVGTLGHDDVLAGIVALHERSLLVRLPELGTGDDSRSGMLETVREYARERLAASREEAALRRRHATWCLDLAERTEPGLWGTDQSRLLAYLDAEHDNLRTALTFLEAEPDSEPMLRLAGALAWYWFVSGHMSEGRAWLGRALVRGDGSSAARARAMLGAGWLAHYQGDTDHAVPLVNESLDLARRGRDTKGIATATYLLGVLAEDDADSATAADRFTAALALFEEAGNDPVDRARTLSHLGVVAWAQDDPDQAITYLEEATSLHRQARDLWGTSMSLNLLGLIACDRRDYEQAATLHAESLARWSRLGSTGDVSGHRRPAVRRGRGEPSGGRWDSATTGTGYLSASNG